MYVSCFQFDYQWMQWKRIIMHDLIHIEKKQNSPLMMWPVWKCEILTWRWIENTWWRCWKRAHVWCITISIASTIRSTTRWVWSRCTTTITSTRAHTTRLSTLVIIFSPLCITILNTNRQLTSIRIKSARTVWRSKFKKYTSSFILFLII